MNSRNLCTGTLADSNVPRRVSYEPIQSALCPETERYREMVEGIEEQVQCLTSWPDHD